MGGEPERPLSRLNGVEHEIALERLRGLVWIEITRINGELAKLEEDVARTERFNKEALNLAQGGLDKHLTQLNDNTTKTLAAQAMHAQEMIKATSELQSKDMATRDKKELEARIGSDKREIENRVDKNDARIQALELSGQNLQGKLWLPLIVVGAVAVGVGAALAKLVFP